MKRYLDPGMKRALQNDPLWIQKIKQDCETQNVFLAIRNGLVDFYHKGGRLFCYNGEFKTHLKYASVLIKKADESYLTESDLKTYELANNFMKKYARIKENCSKYSGIEAAGVASIYHTHSYLSPNKSDVVILDIEVSFVSLTDAKKQDRIDILLFNKKTGMLQFVEAKHYSSKEIRSKTQPKVVAQIQRYEAQISKNKTKILAEYKKYVNYLNSIFGTNLPSPTSVDKNVTLLVFGFDSDQQKGGLKKLVTPKLATSSNPASAAPLSGIKFYAIGNISGVDPKTLWNAKIVT